ncbi:hypothetical protein [Acidovorax sp. LjRoot117]|uniref:hypothetical protein n=1 Tax=Acidovorax sp. LjRoot117 TaxID=3342255 RepID=UPI003ECF28F9
MVLPLAAAPAAGVTGQGAIIAGTGARGGGMLLDPTGTPYDKRIPYSLEEPDRPPPQPPKLPDPFVALIAVALAVVSIPNVLLHTYIDKRKDDADCKKELEKYGVATHRDLKNKSMKNVTASHHVLQNAFLQNARGGSAGSISGCPSYDVDDGIAMLINDVPGQDHDKITAMQDKFSRSYRENGTSPTYPEARDQMKKELSEIKNPLPMTPIAAECIALKVDEMMAKKCPAVLTGSKPLHVPYSRKDV